MIYDTFNQYQILDPEQAKLLSIQLYEQSKDFKSNNQIDQAINVIDQAINIRSDYYEAHILRGELLLDIDHSKAMNDFNKAIQLNIQSSEGYYHRSICYMKQKDFNSALNDCNISIQINPNFPLVHVRKGLVLVNLHHKEEALKCYQRALDIDQNCWQAYNNRGLDIVLQQGALFTDMKKISLAFMDYNKSIEINPNGDLAYNNRGLLYKDTGKFDLSLQDFNKSIQLNQNNASAYFNRGLIFQKLGNQEQGLYDFNKAIEIDNTNSMYYLTRGALLQKMGKNQQASEDFQKALGNMIGIETGKQQQFQNHPIQEPQKSSQGCCCQIY